MKPTRLEAVDSDWNPFPKPEFVKASASKVAVEVVVDTMASEFEENDSEREPRKSISAPFEEIGAAVQVHTKSRITLYILLRKQI